MPINLLSSLFRYRPREGKSSAEDFLTEAFAHALRDSPEALERWLVRCSDSGSEVHLRPDSVPAIETQHRFSDLTPGSRGRIADLWIEGEGKAGRPVTILGEHKWDSPTDVAQLEDYLSAAAALDASGHDVAVVYIGASYGERAKARQLFLRHASEYPSVKTHALLWSDVHAELEKVSDTDLVVAQFCEFLVEQGLGGNSEPSVARLAAYVAGSAVPAQMQSLSRALDELGKSWDFLPEWNRQRRALKDLRWGRVGLEFCDGWRPGLFVGFLLDGSDHGLKLTDRDRGIDILLTLDWDKRATLTPRLRDLLEDKAAAANALPGVVARGPSDLVNRWRKLTVQSCLADALEGAENRLDVAGNVYQVVEGWGGVLFGDGALEEALGMEFPDR